MNFCSLPAGADLRGIPFNGYVSRRRKLNYKSCSPLVDLEEAYKVICLSRRECSASATLSQERFQVVFEMLETLSSCIPSLGRETAFHGPRPSFPREVLILLTICSAQAMVQAVLAQSIIPAEVIGKTFHAQEADIPWYPAAYALTSGTFMLPFGRVGDILGHKRLLVWAWAWLGLWSLLAGLSVYTLSQVYFCICRAMQGIAAAALVPSALAMLGTIYKPGPRKNLAFSLFAAGAPIGFTLGAIFSALLSQLASWPWMFYATAIVCLLYCSCGYFVFPNPQLRLDSGHEPPKFDYLGSVTGTSGTFRQAGCVRYGWLTIQVLSCSTSLGIVHHLLVGPVHNVL